MVNSENIRVGDMLELHAKDRVPADVVILSTC
jgi:magnesium-transporting ATPase (P-type)